MKIHALKDGDFFVNKNKSFYNLEEAKGLAGLHMAIQPFLIEFENENILLDAGLGWIENGQQKLISNLEKLGKTPQNIDKILLSHLHKDHIEGLVSKEKSGWKLNFPDVKTYLQKREYEYAMQNAASASFDLVVLKYIVDHANIIWLEEDKGEIGANIKFEVSGGHTPFHQVFWMHENEEIAFYGADNLPMRAYLRMHVAYKTDFNGKKAMEDRQKWEIQAKENRWIILFYHDLKQAIKQF